MYECAFRLILQLERLDQLQLSIKLKGGVDRRSQQGRVCMDFQNGISRPPFMLNRQQVGNALKARSVDKGMAIAVKIEYGNVDTLQIFTNGPKEGFMVL